MTPREKGVQAFQQGISQLDNPFVRYSHDWDLWKEGWMDAWRALHIENVNKVTAQLTMDLCDPFKVWPI